MADGQGSRRVIGFPCLFLIKKFKETTPQLAVHRYGVLFLNIFFLNLVKNYPENHSLELTGNYILTVL